MSKEGIYVCAEIGVGWGGNQDILINTVKGLARRKIDAMKLQYFDEQVLESYEPELREKLKPMCLTLDQISDISRLKEDTDLIVTPFSVPLAKKLLDIVPQLDGIKIRHTDWRDKKLSEVAELSKLPVYTSVPYLNAEMVHFDHKEGMMTEPEALQRSRGSRYYRIYCLAQYPPKLAEMNLFMAYQNFDGVSLHSTNWEDYFACAVVNTYRQYVQGQKRRFYVEAHVCPDLMDVIDKEVSLSMADIWTLQRACDRLEETIG